MTAPTSSTTGAIRLGEADWLVAAILFGVRDGWMSLPLRLRDHPGLADAVSHRMARMSHRISGTGLELGEPPARIRPLRELFGDGSAWRAREKSAALGLARTQKWDCVHTRINLGPGEYRLTVKGGSTVIELPGEPRIEPEVDSGAAPRAPRGGAARPQGRGAGSQAAPGLSTVMRMVPSSPYDTGGSQAEKRIFDRLRRAFDDRWVACHSLKPTRHPRKRFPEIDFVICGPEGLYALEVKGGRVACREGVWQYEDRYGRTVGSHEGPFRQAETALHGLMEDLRAGLPVGALDRITVGYGVLFPDCDFRTESAEWDRAMVADARASRDLEGWLRRLFAYWRERDGSSGPGRR